MAELIANGRKKEDRWRRVLPVREAFVLGRSAPPWSVSWDSFISRQHAQLTWDGSQLEVVKLDSGRNPIYLNGQPTARFTLKPGDRFVIGETTFILSVETQLPTANLGQLLKERTFSAQALKQVKVADAAHHLDMLSRLPEVIAHAANERELFTGLTNLLLAGIPHADVVALMAVAGKDPPTTSLLYWDRRQPADGGFQPSNRLIVECVRRQETVMHVWPGGMADSFTQDAGFDWAFATPVRGLVGRGWAIYLAGRFSGELASTVMGDKDPAALLDDLKFTELVSALWAALEQVNVLKHRQASLSQFFSPAVLRTLSEADPDMVLQPRKAEVTVLFCDLRGFSKEAERRELLDMLEGVSKALGYMTQNILDQGGVIGDFHGDAAMGFWGWPLAQPDAARRVCLAALGIRALFEARSAQADHPLAGFRVGIGIATGSAVAGKIGTVDQVKVTVFGPVVNLAARLESMTKILRAPVLLDEATAKGIREQVPADLVRVRRLAHIRPSGVDTTLTVSELLPPLAEYPLLTNEHIADYEEALESFVAGKWHRAYDLLHRLPPQDRGKDFLTAFILQNNHTPPRGWDGVISLSGKD